MISIGCDFGTSNSAAAIVKDGTAVDIQFKGESFFPTCLYRRRRGKYFVGMDAIATYLSDHTGHQSKFVRRDLDRSIDINVVLSETKAAQLGMKEDSTTVSVPIHTLEDTALKGRFFKSLKTALRYPTIRRMQVFNDNLPLFRLLEQFFRAIMDAVRAQTGSRCDAIVVGMPVPVEQEPAMKRHYEMQITTAAKEAGFREVSFALEPVAASVERARTLADGTALVFDFGGGTLDCSVVGIEHHEAVVRANAGLLLGGDDFDREIQKLLHPLLGRGAHTRSIGGVLRDMPAVIYDKLLTLDGIMELSQAHYETLFMEIRQTCDNPNAGAALYHLVKGNYGYAFMRACEETKIALSSKTAAPMAVSFGPSGIASTIHRTEFETAIAGHAENVASLIDEVIKRAGLTTADIDMVIPVGGSTQIPLVQQILERRFGRDRMKSAELFTSISKGLALIAHQRYASK
ncbi:MAG: Hsp70 family protein [Spirochaetes bacterium]|nr:Hsp70 family protein [Spirochaetota bacterium]